MDVAFVGATLTVARRDKKRLRKLSRQFGTHDQRDRYVIPGKELRRTL